MRTDLGAATRACPRPLCNVPVFDRFGQHIGTPDLLDPVAGVVGEYDGALHLERLPEATGPRSGGGVSTASASSTSR